MFTTSFFNEMKLTTEKKNTKTEEISILNTKVYMDDLVNYETHDTNIAVFISAKT